MAKPTKHRGKWRIRWFDESGTRRSKSFTTHTAAVKALRQVESELDDWRAGLGEAPVQDQPFSTLCDHQLKYKTPKKRSPKDDNYMIELHLRPFFGRMQLSQIGVAAIDRFTSIKRAHGLSDKTVNNLLTLLGTMLRLAVDLGWLRRLPKIQKLKVAETAFQYLRTDDELRRFLSAARDDEPGIYELYAAAVYTGMRFGELAGLCWSDINFERRLITVQRSYDKPTKSSRVRHVPILDPLLPVLRVWRLQNPLPIVFPNQRGMMHGPSARVSQEILHRVLEAAGFPKVERDGKLRSYIRFHDLRHTFASHWVMSGGDIFRLQKILGHSTITMTERYAHLAPDAFADDYARLGDALPTVCADVVPLDAAK